ncbi:MAG TPA: ATP-binding cassette domain-containing protein [Acidobacteriota bacterium]|nr:ATP-binding cassette domain-containing protein [Acidobacteriota bacterium]
MIEFKDVSYRYGRGGPPVLEHVNLTLRKGESVCIMGPNGSGKTTLAHILAGLVRGYGGSATVNGCPAGERDGRSRVGVLFQNPDNQMVATLVEKEIAFALENQAMPCREMERKVAETARSFQIEHLLRRLTTELSGGEKQRVALAALMVSRPPVLVLDEPDSFLDVPGRRILEKELVRIRTSQPGLIEVRITQYPSVAARYPRLIVLAEGGVVADGRPGEVFADAAVVDRARLCLTDSQASAKALPAALAAPAQPHGRTLRAIHLEGVGFGYAAQKPLLRDLNLVLNRGEVLAVIGATGVGKSTLGLLLCGIYQPVEGIVRMIDRDGKSLPGAGVTGQVVGSFQQPERQFFLSSCQEEIAFGPKNMGRHLSPEELAALLDLVDLDPARFGTRDPFTLSMGEKRRLAFAAVLSMAPAFAVFDEPTCGLDTEGVSRFLALSRLLKSRNVGLVVISHEGDLIKAVADRVLWLKGNGEAVETTVDDLFARDECRDVVSPFSRTFNLPERPG